MAQRLPRRDETPHERIPRESCPPHAPVRVGGPYEGYLECRRCGARLS